MFHNFVYMKKSTIWIISIVMGASFLALLFLQVNYFEEFIEMRKEQFDESVSRSLYQAAHNMELDETMHGLEQEIIDSLPKSQQSSFSKQLSLAERSSMPRHPSISMTTASRAICTRLPSTSQPARKKA